jgi:trehalose 6-phosphate synthase/phosphatase
MCPPNRRDPGTPEGDPIATDQDERLLVVSNRLPLTVRRTGGRWQAERSSGGLVAALAPIVERANGLWIGWPGEAPAGADEGRAELLAAWERDKGMASVDLPASMSRAFYEGYSNGTLWPLLHGFPGRATIDGATWDAYVAANERFADAVVERMRPDDLVWIQDYQLFLLPAMLRERRPEARIAFFLHIPFPPAETFRILPQREALLTGLLGADVIAFQSYEHVSAFRRALIQVLGYDSHMDRIEVDGRVIALNARPIGISPAEWDRSLRGARAKRRIEELRASYAGRSLVLAVDRLDHTKGIPERLRALRRFFALHPERRGTVTLVQVAVPSREGIPRYAALRREVNELVGEINGELGTAEWNPVVYLRRPVSKLELTSLYAAADVAWVASLRDGMNLVAKEFVACQEERGGVLLLSEFAGAAAEMGEAIRVNPYDEQGSAEALERALTMPEDERRERQAALHARVRRDTAQAWAERSVDDLRGIVADRATIPGPLPAPDAAVVRTAAMAVKRRAFFLDYDGSLVALASRPAEAIPGPEVARTLEALARVPGSTVALVSGRSTRDLERWFGGVPDIWIAAEHGALIRAPGEHEWRLLRPGANAGWMDAVRPVLEHLVERAPGSFVEEKQFALAWHYRLVEPEFGQWIAREVAANLEAQLAGTELAVLRGSKVVEVRFAWANKGEVAAHLRSLVEPQWELALGDDRTDEDLFERLGPDAVTIKVGPGPTRARYRVAGPKAALALLGELATDPISP